MMISFSKYQAAGNDFIIIDDRAAAFPCEKKKSIQMLCHRRFGIGADGLLLLQASARGSCRIRIFNPDGCEVAMCGNGMRCFIDYLRSLGFREDRYLIETMHDMIQCRMKGGKIAVQLDKPYVLHWGVPIDLEDRSFEAFVVHTGVPHAVIFVDDLEGVDINRLGPAIRHHPLFAPDGVNVNFVKKGSDGAFRVRTYERGVEAETYACGTGAAAVALTAYQKWNAPSPVRVMPLSAECLEVYVRPVAMGGQELELIGRAACVFTGKVDLESFS